MLREDARLTGKDLAARLGWQQSKVSRLENGKQTATIEDVEAWVQAVQASAEQYDVLVAELRAMHFEYATWKHQLRSGTTRRQRAAGLDTITLAIIPFTATLPVVPSHAFTMFDDTLVLVETIGAELAFRATEEKALYAEVFERLWKVGAQNDNATTLINKVIEELPK